MTLGERIKKVRKALDLTQQEFANQIGTTRNNIAGYETGRREPSVAAIALIITKLNVSEEWLRNETGEMFQPKPETVIDEIVQEYKLDDLDRQIIKEFIELPDKDREAIRVYLQSIISARKQDEAAKKAAFLKMAEEQYDLEQERAKQASSANGQDAV